MSDLTAEDVAWLKALRPALDSALRLHDSTTDHHPDAVEILRAMNAAGRGEEGAEPFGSSDYWMTRALQAENAYTAMNDRRIAALDVEWSGCSGSAIDVMEQMRSILRETLLDTRTPAPDVTAEVRAPRWHKGEDAPDWLVPGATVRVVECLSGGGHIGADGSFDRLDHRGYAVMDRISNRAGSYVCVAATVLELVAPAPEPAVDWEARAKATEDRIARALDVHDKWHYDVATCRRGYSNAAICRAADILRGES